MRVLVVCQHYYPENFQITPICEQLVSDGYDVTVLTGLPNYPLGVVPDEYKKGHRDEMINGVHVLRCREIGRKKGAFNLAINYFSFWHSSMHKVRKITESFDIVFAYQLSPVMMAFAGMKYAKKHSVPFFLYCCDLWPESMKVYIKSEANLIFKIFKSISKKVYSSCDRIACQSISFKPYLISTHNIEASKLTYIPAFADDTYLSSDLLPDNSEYVNFVFLGNLGKAQDLISVLKAIEIISDLPNFNVHFVGDGSCLDEMKLFVHDHQLENCVKFYGRRPVDEMPKFYKLADACIVSLKGDNQIGWTLPSKVQGYMAAGKPILGMIDGSAKTVIEESHCGICVSAGDYVAFADAMKEFVTNKSKYLGCGEAGREYFRVNFSKSVIMNSIENELNYLGECKNE